MIQPTSKLPWKEELSRNKKKYQIRDANLKIVVDNVESSLGDAMYIEEACNNYPKAIDYLEKIGWYLDSINAQHELDGLNNWNKIIKEFLNEIENGN